jgi:hypothetical protein
VTRRLLLALAIALAAAAGFWVLRGSRPPAAVSSEPHADIDEASRAKLEQILEDADRKESGSGEAAPEPGQGR